MGTLYVGNSTPQQLTTYAIPYRRPAVTTLDGDEAQHVFSETVSVTFCEFHCNTFAEYVLGPFPANAVDFGVRPINRSPSSKESCDHCEAIRSGGSLFTILIERVLGLAPAPERVQ